MQQSFKLKKKNVGRSGDQADNQQKMGKMRKK
jgi:hypothetical protein